MKLSDGIGEVTLLPAPLRSLAAIIDFLTDPILVIDGRRTILLANGAATRVLRARTGLSIQRGCLAMLSPDADSQLQRIVSDVSQSSLKHEKCRGVRVPRQSASRDWLLIISPLPITQSEVLDRSAFLVHLVSRIHPRLLPGAALHDLFDLTKKEINVLHRVVRHESTPAIAQQLCLSDETIKAYLKRIFRKCDVRSRSDLIALLHRISLLSTSPSRATKKYPVGGIGSERADGKLRGRSSKEK